MMISALNRKLFRDLQNIRGQALAIALVVAAGVTLYVTYLANFESLRRTQQVYYQRQHFADVFASLKRAPLSVAAQIREISGVIDVETRVVADVPLDLEGVDQPATGRLVSIPADRRPAVNDIYLRSGRWIDPDRHDEILVSEGFARANRVSPGDTVRAIINGRLRRLSIAGVALSPEYIYSSNPGELVPDDRRFGVFWINEHTLAAAFDMEGGFNDVALTLSPGASAEAVVAALDTILEAYGGRGAVPRALQYSHWALENELTQLESFGIVLPMIFLAVAAFVLHVALTRALALQRPQIAALKALGYGNTALAWHYTKWALAIGGLGLVLGMAGGLWMGSVVGEIYNRYFRFPELIFSVPPRTLLTATLFTLGAASAGAYAAVRRAVSIPAAEAMRPEAPARFGRTIFDTPFIARQLGLIGRIVIRNVSRRPLRAGLSVAGIACGVALLMVGLVMFDAMDRLIGTTFSVADRQDVAVTFVEPRSAAVRHALARLPGVLAVEPQRAVAARVRSGPRDRTLSIVGIQTDGRLERIVDANRRVIPPPLSGVAVSRTLGALLAVQPGDEVTLEILEGARPHLRVVVATLVDDVLGLSVYMEMSALHRLMREGDTATGALLLVDRSMERQLTRALKSAPTVAGVTLKRAVLQSFRDTMAATMDVTIAINVLFASIVAIGVVYNAARVSLSERSRELASLRVLGYTRAEISLVLMGELALLTFAALPIGVLLGYGLASLVFQSVQSEVYRFPLFVSTGATAQACLGVLGAALVAALAVRRRLDRLDLIAVLKMRE